MAGEPVLDMVVDIACDLRRTIKSIKPKKKRVKIGIYEIKTASEGRIN
jgi:hypothetical protein